jgi:hypothetical protein
MMQSILATCSILGLGVFAQEIRTFQFQGMPHIGMGVGDARFISAEFAEGRVVKGAPYSAEASTETVQVLADGNRISRKITNSVARDGEGRTRREETLGQPGSAEQRKFIFINDPVAQTTYVLDNHSKEARVTPSMQSRAVLKEMEAKRAAERGMQTTTVTTGYGTITNFTSSVERHEGDRVRAEHSGRGEKVEQLGTRTIHGVQAEGRRVTNTIAAGEIGNERPIEVVRETWYSSELQITLMSTTSDPRIGATTYEVTNLQRGEPSQSLFEVPAGYTTVKGNVMMRVERKENNKE